jgi:Lar family restriction alleviation protein
MNRVETLAPCPFCGATGDDLMLFCDPREERDNSGPSRRVQCAGCNVEAPFYSTQAEAIEAWNRRTPIAAGSGDATEALQARLWNASGELAAHGGFDNHCRTIDEAAAALSTAGAAEPAGYLFELCYSHAHDRWSGTMYSATLPNLEDVRNVRPLVFASPPSDTEEKGL